MLNKTMLKYIYSAFLALFASLIFSGAALAGDAPLADTHGAIGVKCNQCHKEKVPSKAVKSAQCETCHGNNDAMAKKTENVKPNPHFNHLGDVACTECHHAHAPSKLICNDCHKFEMKMP